VELTMNRPDRPSRLATRGDAGFALVGLILGGVLAGGVILGAVQFYGSNQNRPDQSIPAENPTRPAGPELQPGPPPRPAP
jgi:hypothetical protein